MTHLLGATALFNFHALSFIALTMSVRSFFSTHFWQLFIVFVAADVAFSLSLPRIWLSHSTSETDALEEDETPLRLTASQTATTQGVRVSDALAIAPTLHFVEPGLKINGEEWIKVMDEHTPPTCAALMHGACAKIFIALGQRDVARVQAGL